jgi:tripartite-type tricarboxylate transporter receptor subunit TctC
MLCSEAGIEFNIIDGGDAASKATALLGKQIDVTILPYGTAKGYMDSGDFRALAVAREDRNHRYADVPTFIECGYNVVCPTPYSFLMPKGTDQAIVKKLAATIQKIRQRGPRINAENHRQGIRFRIVLQPAEEALSIL